MFKGQLSALITINLLYANPQATLKARRKGQSTRQITRALVRQYILIAILFLVIYGGMMASLNYRQLPGYFTRYIGVFTIMALSQSVSTINNVFYESKDLTAYLPLPFGQGQVFTAKILVVALTVVPFILPLFALFLLTALRSSYGPVLEVIVGLITFILFFVLIFLVCALIVFGLTQTKGFQRHRKLFTFLMIGITMVAMVIGILYLSSSQSNYSDVTKIKDQTPIAILLPIHHLLVQPFSGQGMGTLLGLVALILLAMLMIVKRVVPRLYQGYSTSDHSKRQANKRYVKPKNFNAQLRHYNFGLLKNPTLMSQALTNTLLLPVIFIASFAVSGGFNLSGVGRQYTGVFLLAGLIFSLMTLNQSAIVSNIISLDGPNFEFIKSLPLTLHAYLKFKFLFAVSIQTALLWLVGIGLSLFGHFNLWLIVGLFAGLTLGNFLGSLYYFARDYRLLVLNWTDLSQLFNRGGGNFALFIILMVTMIVGSLFVVGYAVAISFLNPLWVNLGFGVVIALVSLFVMLHYYTGFWQQLRNRG